MHSLHCPKDSATSARFPIPNVCMCLQEKKAIGAWVDDAIAYVVQASDVEFRSKVCLQRLYLHTALTCCSDAVPVVELDRGMQICKLNMPERSSCFFQLCSGTPTADYNRQI